MKKVSQNQNDCPRNNAKSNQDAFQNANKHQRHTVRFERIEADFLVVGGGLAGMFTAITASRKGLKTVLMHDRPVFGGNASSEIRMWIRGASLQFPEYRECGLLEELALENMYYNPDMEYTLWDAVLHNKIISEPNLTALLNCSLNGASTENGNITSINGWQLSTYTQYEVHAKYFADCSGDGILASLTGAEARSGREAKTDFKEDMAENNADGLTMGNSCILQLRETSHPVKYVAPPFARAVKKEDLGSRINFRSRKGFLQTNYWWIELGGEEDTLKDAEHIKNRLLATAYGVWDYIKNSGEFDAENWQLDFVSFLSGKRESLRYIGAHTLTQNDIEKGGVFENEIAYGGWPIDNHYPSGFGSNKSDIHTFKIVEPYGIPLGCIYSKNIKNLFFAGRNISATHVALSSTRIMATCAMLGQAVGTAVYIAFKHNISASDTNKYIRNIQRELLDDDSFLLHTQRQVSDCLLNAHCNLETERFSVLKNGKERNLKNEENAISLKENESLELIFDRAVAKENAYIRVVFDSDLLRTDIKDLELKQFPQLSHRPLDAVRAEMPKTLVKEYVLEILKDGKWSVIKHETQNIKRLVKVYGIEGIEGVRLIPKSTYGRALYRIFSLDVVQ